MTNTHESIYSRKKRCYWLCIVLLGILSAYFAIKYAILDLHVRFAEEQVRIFEQMKAAAAGTSDPREAAGCLGYAWDYYNSGSKQVTGSHLDRVVETARSNCVSAIITRLRTVTGKDLGDDPGKWLKEYPTDVVPVRKSNPQ